MAHLLPRLKQSIMVCLLAAWPLLGLGQAHPPPAPTQAQDSGVRLEVSRNAPLAPDDPLALWFREQDRLLDDILLRLARIEALVSQIHRLVIELPAPAPPARPAAPAATPVPLKLAPPPAIEDGPLTSWLPYLVAASLIVLLFSWLQRHRARTQAGSQDRAETDLPAPTAMRPMPAAAPRPPMAPAAAPESIAVPAAAPRDEQFEQAIELADIMLSMGLGQGAADTLVEQIRQEPKRALRHWLKLLEIYRQSGQQAEFERSAEELRQHFNVQPEDWLVLVAGQASLEDYPHIAARLVELWGKPGCLPYLQNLLSDNRGGARSGFPQTVAEELLLLISLSQSSAPR